MFRNEIRLLLVLPLLAILMIGTRGTADAENLAGTDVESRVIVALAVDAEALKSMLPDAWTPISFPSGPLKGANVLVSFIDGHVALDPEGKPLSPSSRRAVSIISLARQQTGKEVRLYLIGVYAAGNENDPYGLKTTAEISRAHTLSGPSGEGRLSNEAWSVVPETGGELSLLLEFKTGRRGWGLSESTVYSAGNPDFMAVYRWDSLTDVVMSTEMAKQMNGSFSLSNSVPELASIIDGKEKVMAILDIPVRVRRTFSP